MRNYYAISTPTSYVWVNVTLTAEEATWSDRDLAVLPNANNIIYRTRDLRGPIKNKEQGNIQRKRKNYWRLWGYIMRKERLYFLYVACAFREWRSLFSTIFFPVWSLEALLPLSSSTSPVPPSILKISSGRWTPHFPYLYCPMIV